MSLDGTANYFPLTINGLQDVSADSQTVTTLQVNSLTPNRVVVSDSNDYLTSAGATAQEVDYLIGTTSSVQNQLNTKASLTYVDTNFLNKTTSTQQNITAFCDFKSDLVTDSVYARSSYYIPKTTFSTHGWNITRQLNGSVLKDLLFRELENNVDCLLLSEDGQTVYVSLKCDYATASKIPVFDANKKLISSGVDAIKITYLDNVSSDIQTQLNSKLNLSGSNANQNIVIGAYKVQSSAVPSTGNDYTNKTYVDGQVGLYLPLAGGTMTGTIVMGANKITTSYTPVNAEDLTRKGYVDSLVSNLLTSDNTWTGINTFSRGTSPIVLSGLTGNRLLGLGVAKDIQTINATLLEGSYLAGVTSGIQGQLDGKGNLATTNTWTSTNTFSAANPINLSFLSGQRALILDASKNIQVSTTTSTELGYVSGVTSGIQGQLDGKVAKAGDTMTGQLQISTTGFAPLMLTRTSAGTNFGVGTIHSLISSGGFQGYYARAFGGSNGAVATTAQSQANGYYSIDVANAGVFGSDTSPDNSTVYITASSAKFKPDINALANLYASGNVGVGVTSSLVARLQVNNAGGTDFLTLQNTNYAFNDYVNQRFLFGDPAGSNRSAYFQAVLTSNNETDMLFYVAPSTGGVLERFRVKGNGTIVCNGDVGIGTVPTSRLHLYTLGTHQVRFQTSAVDNHYITAAQELFAFNANLSLTGIPNTGRGSSQIVLQTPTAGGIIQFLTGSAVNTAPSERMRITGDGNVGIGTNAPPTALCISRAFSADGDYSGMLSYQNTLAGYFDWQLGAQVIGGQALFSLRGGADGFGSLANLATFQANGHLGIGTTNSKNWAGGDIPNAFITLRGGNIGAVNGKSRISLGANSNHYSAIQAEHTGSGATTLSFWTCQSAFVNGSDPYERMTINEIGYVGIGTTQPNHTLDVQRDVRTGTHPSGYALYVTRLTTTEAMPIAAFRHSNGTQGINIGYNTISASGENTNQPLQLAARGNETINLLNKTTVSSGDSSVTIYGPNTTWSAFLRCGSGASGVSANTAQMIVTNGNLHLDSSFDQNIYLNYYSNAAARAGIVFSYNNWRHEGRVYINGNVGIGSDQNTNRLEVYSTTADYTNSVVIKTPWAGITLDNTQIAFGRKWGFFSGGPGAGVGVGSLGIFDLTAGRYCFNIEYLGNIMLGSGFNAWTKVGINGGGNGNVSGGVWTQSTNGLLITVDGVNQNSQSDGCLLAFQQGYTSLTSLYPGVVWRDINMYANNYALHTGGVLNVVLYAGIAGWVTISDEREKEDIQDLKTDKSLNRIMALRPKHYRRKYYENETPVSDEIKQMRHVGFLAQEVLESNPHCVAHLCNKETKTEEDDGDRLGINYGDLNIHLVGAVQEQQRMINEQQCKLVEQQKQLDTDRKEIEILQQRNQILEERLAKLEQMLERIAVPI